MNIKIIIWRKCLILWWVIHIWRPLWWVRRKLDVIGCRGMLRSYECCGCPIFIFFIEEDRICAMTRHHAESNISILLTRYLLFASAVRQWSHPLMIPLPCLWAKPNNKTRGPDILANVPFEKVSVVITEDDE